MLYNVNAGYGRGIIDSLSNTTGKVFVLVGSSFTSDSILSNLFVPDVEGTSRLLTSYAQVIANVVAGRGDLIYVHPSFTTAPTAAELLSLETSGASVVSIAGRVTGMGNVTNRATAVLPATTTGSIFTVTGRIKLISIIGEVTTAIQNQACTLKVTATPTVGSAVDLCTAGAVTNATVGTELTITGTLATALQTSNGAVLFTASPILVKAGTLDLTTSATNTGSVKWKVIYEPIDPGAKVIAL